MNKKTTKFSPEVRERAVRLVRDLCFSKGFSNTVWSLRLN